MSDGNLSNFRYNLIRMVVVFFVVAVIPIAFVFIQGCQEGPFGRRQLVGLTREQESQLGAQTFQDVLAHSSVQPSGPLVDKIKEIGDRLAKASKDPEFLKLTKTKPQNFSWDYRLVHSKQVNAFCLPGGKVVVYTGIVPVCETEE